MSSRDPKVKIERSKAFASGYAQSNVIKYEDAINRMIEKLLGWIDTYVGTDKPMALDEFISFTTFDVVGEVLFSKEFGFLDKGEDISNAIRNNIELEKLGTPLSQFKWTQVLLGNPLVTMLGLTPSSLLLQNALANLKERQKNPDARFDVVAHWLRYLEQHPDRTTFRNVEAQTTTNIGAGSDTVSCGIQSTFYHMIRHPETWAKAQNEIATARRNGLCEGRVVSFSDAQELPYLQACIKEGLRIHSPVPSKYLTNYQLLTAPKTRLTKSRHQWVCRALHQRAESKSVTTIFLRAPRCLLTLGCSTVTSRYGDRTQTSSSPNGGLLRMLRDWRNTSYR